MRTTQSFLHVREEEEKYKLLHLRKTNVTRRSVCYRYLQYQVRNRHRWYLPLHRNTPEVQPSRRRGQTVVTKESKSLFVASGFLQSFIRPVSSRKSSLAGSRQVMDQLSVRYSLVLQKVLKFRQSSWTVSQCRQPAHR